MVLIEQRISDRRIQKADKAMAEIRRPVMETYRTITELGTKPRSVMLSLLLANIYLNTLNRL